MDIENQIMMCTNHYNKWKQEALFSKDNFESKKALERAFFWLELQTAFIVLHAIEQMRGKDPQTKKKLISAKANLSKKLADYAKGILGDLGF